MNGHSTLSRFPRAQRGFTLIEIAIVLVVIGLLIGGLLAAQSLISAARINAQVRQLQQFDIATQQYIGSFNVLPGEPGYRAKGVYWTGAMYGNHKLDVACCANPGGDNRLGLSEAGFFFSDLHEAGYISENYIATFGPNNGGSYYLQPPFGIGSMLPLVKLSGAGAAVIPVSNGSGQIFWFLAQPNQPFDFNYQYYGGNYVKTIDAAALDSKVDDGLPASGDVIAVNIAPGIASADSDYLPLPVAADDGTCISGGKYNSSLSSPQCNLLVKANIY